MALYMGLLYITYHFLVSNIGCGIDKAILDLLQLYELVDDRFDFTYVHIRYFIGYAYHICLQDTISVNTIVMSSLPSNVAPHATATSASDPTVWFRR